MDELVVGWILSGDDTIPGARINGTNLHRQMLCRGIQSMIIRQPRGLVEHLTVLDTVAIKKVIAEHRLNVVIFQKVNGQEAVALSRWLKNENIRPVFIACDTVDNQMAEACDRTLTVSSFLKRTFARHVHKKIQVLNDAIEVPQEYLARETQLARLGRLKAVYLGSVYPTGPIRGFLQICSHTFDVTVISAAPQQSTKWAHKTAEIPPEISLEGVNTRVRSAFDGLRRKGSQRLLREIAYQYRQWTRYRPVCTEKGRGWAFRAWNRDNVYEDLSEFQIGIIPVALNSDFYMAKSANRFATLLAMGLVVVASPVPSYLECAQHGQHALFADTALEWKNAMCWIDRHREAAGELGIEGAKMARKIFAPEAITDQLISQLRLLD